MASTPTVVLDPAAVLRERLVRVLHLRAAQLTWTNTSTPIEDIQAGIALAQQVREQEPYRLEARANMLEEEARVIIQSRPIPGTKAELDAHLKMEAAGRLRDRAADLRRARARVPAWPLQFVYKPC